MLDDDELDETGAASIAAALAAHMLVTVIQLDSTQRDQLAAERIQRLLTRGVQR